MRTRWALALPVLVALALSPNAGARVPHPDSVHQPERDGCERNPAGLLVGESPQWVYVNRDAAPKYLRGVARNAYPSGDDLFTAHGSYDLNTFFDPDPAFESFLGTANIGQRKTQERDELDTMEVEWEQGALPLFAFPTAGDRLEVMGSWIWDCGHWREEKFTDETYWQPGAQPGEPVTGERTEIHPPRMLVVHRATPSVSPRGDALTDVVISSDGTTARGVEDQVIGNCVVTQHLCSQWTPVNDRNYSFDIDAPRRPPGARKVVWQVVDAGSVNAPTPRVSATRRGVHVEVPFRGFGNTGDRMVFAKRFAVGWDKPRPVHHYRVQFDRFTFLAELDSLQPLMCVSVQPCTDRPQDTQPPDELNFFVEVAGQWRQVTPQVTSPLPCATGTAGLFCANVGDAFPLSATFDVYLADGAPWRLLTRARECDQPRMRECDVPYELGLPDDAGIAQRVLRAGGRVAGRYSALGSSKRCTLSAKSPCFRVDYRIEDLGRTP
ncbi:MAG: hypothetical protein ABR520_09675 [Mycobacteriales bacterium]